MVKYCKYCKNIHEDGEVCPNLKEQLSQHPEWINGVAESIISANATSEVVQRYGSANNEFFKACDGKNPTGNPLKKSLMSVHHQKGSDYTILRQKAGWDAEVLDTAKENTDRIIDKDTNRQTRTDDIGRVNDTVADTVMIDNKGNVIPDTETQMKFVGKDAKAAKNKVCSKEFQKKYFDKGAKMKVPKDYYDRIVELIDNDIKSLQTQYDNLLKKGDVEKANQKLDKIKSLKKVKKNLLPSSVSLKEAVFAAKHPKLATAKEVAKVSNRAGLEGAKYGAVSGGAVSLLRNVVAYKNGDVEGDEVVINVAKDTVISAGSGYVVSFSGSVLKGAMEHSENAFIQSLSKTKVSGATIGLVYTVTVDTISNYSRYRNGEIKKQEFYKEVEKNSVKAALLSAGMAMIVFPEGVAGMAVAAAVGIYFDAVCTNLLEEIFGEGLYEQILHSTGYILATTQNMLESLNDYESSILSIDKSNYKSHQYIDECLKTQKKIEKNFDELNKMLEEL